MGMGEMRFGVRYWHVVVFAVVGFSSLLFLNYYLCETCAFHPNAHERVLLELLNAFDDASRVFSFRYFLDYGTLLGAVRENWIIKHDHDVDVGFFHDDRENVDKCFMFMEERGIYIADHRWHLETGYRGYILMKGYVKMDVLAYSRQAWKKEFEPSGGGISVGEECYVRVTRPRDWHSVESLHPMSTHVMNGREYPVPNNPEKVLERLYHASWRTVSPPSVVKSYFGVRSIENLKCFVPSFITYRGVPLLIVMCMFTAWVRQVKWKDAKWDVTIGMALDVSETQVNGNGYERLGCDDDDDDDDDDTGDDGSDGVVCPRGHDPDDGNRIGKGETIDGEGVDKDVERDP
eukprot:TRINITY_DN1598_c0_g1_i1.p1 TRINITY_DN1598_c0_g1~~TRINITY_DN1598_c0_g1_i1.p1  ORF type:complete len:347 (+),score=75.28 TRINITY_DN1598_c0_g1_i1:60-1100(+)